jgi:hypothetical protein
MLAKPMSHPLMTCRPRPSYARRTSIQTLPTSPMPMVNENSFPRVRDESNTVPSSRVPVDHGVCSVVHATATKAKWDARRLACVMRSNVHSICRAFSLSFELYLLHHSCSAKPMAINAHTLPMRSGILIPPSPVKSIHSDALAMLLVSLRSRLVDVVARAVYFFVFLFTFP